uniref:Hipothetical protein n=1 Tax=Schistocephalus solidus TaxID=70667 RepID=A0A183SL36_SCHSO
LDLLLRIRSLAGKMTINDKFFKEMFLKRLPTSVQPILASGSDDVDISKLAEMANRRMEVEHLPFMTVAQVSQPLRRALWYPNPCAFTFPTLYSAGPHIPSSPMSGIINCHHIQLQHSSH